jgi:D-alanyl-D-alanine carboxypeptidase
MVQSATDSRLAGVVDKTFSDPEITGVVAKVADPANEVEWTGARGDIEAGSPFFIASATKLYTTAIILRLVAAGKLDLATPVVELVEGIQRLHLYKGTDYTPRMTVRHLLSQTSGLPDYFQGKPRKGSSLEEELRSGSDRAWHLDDVLRISRGMGAKFPPGTPKKALYSDTNFQLLGAIIERVDGRPYAEAVDHHVVGVLGLGDTWVYVDPADDRPVSLRDGAKRADIPEAMTSFGPDGGIVATVDDLMSLLRAFFEGRLFPESFLPGLMVFNRIFFPLQYGVGISRFRLPRVLSPLSAPPDLIGHSGLSGAFAFMDRDSGAYLAGTVNNIDKPDRSFRMMLALLRAYLHQRPDH